MNGFQEVATYTKLTDAASYNSVTMLPQNAETWGRRKTVMIQREGAAIQGDQGNRDNAETFPRDLIQALMRRSEPRCRRPPVLNRPVRPNMS